MTGFNVTRAIRGVALLVLLLIAAPALAATAREMYAAALARQKALSDASGDTRAAQKARYRAAVAAFEAIPRRHPTSSYADDALWEGARVALDARTRLADDSASATAARLLKWLIEEYPSSKLVTKAREALRDLESPPSAPRGGGAAKSVETAAAQPQPSGGRASAIKEAAGPPSPPRASTAAGAPETAAAPTPGMAPPGDGPTILRDIRRTIVGDIIRVTIQLDAEVVYRSERVENPPRVLFDLASTRLGPAVGEGSISFSGDIVRHLRVGRHPNQVTRVVIDLTGVKRYSVFTLYSPYRIVVDCERDRAMAAPLPTVRVDEEKIAPPPPDPDVADVPPPPPALRFRVFRATAVVPPVVVTPPPLARGPSGAFFVRPPSPRPRLGAANTLQPAAVPPPLRVTRMMAPTRRLPAWQPAIVAPPPIVVTAAPAPAPLSPANAPASRDVAQAGGVAAVESSTVAAPPTERPSPTPEHNDKPVTPSRPLATPPNGFSLARQLGLGASRIVIDPGHGGHDPGAEGSGVYESTIVLDVALRLEKLLSAAGCEVVLTRRTNEYVPLEERTAIANRSQGDLFLSIHANASRNRAARGIESYFLNFATNPDAEAVAARENAATGRTMSNLTDMVKAIALNNKLDESKSFAALVQRQMVDHLQGSNRGLRNHGVKQAPFVVLIGASMPSVLVEISFITNSQEGRLLKSAPYRQKVAEALFDAVRGYQKSLKGAAAVTNQ